MSEPVQTPVQPQPEAPPERMSNERVCTFIQACKQEAESAFSDKRKAWTGLWDMYRCSQDNSKKDAWQSKAFAPKVFMAVTRMAALIKKAVLNTPELFTIAAPMGVEAPPELIADADGRVKEVIEESNFADVIGEACIPAFLCGVGVVKATWEGEPSYESVIPDNVFVDPYWQPYSKKPPRYLIERSETDLASLKGMARKVNEGAGQPVFDVEAIKGLSGTGNGEGSSDEKTRKGLSDFSPATKRVELLIFWGDIVDSDKDDTVEPRQLVILANGTVVRREPWPVERHPYFFLVPLVFPGRGGVGNSTVEPMVRLQITYNNLMNLAIDNANWLVNNMWECDVSAMHSSQTAADLTRVYPGKVIKRQGQNPVLTPVQSVNTLQYSLPLLQEIDRNLQDGSAVNEWISPSPGNAKTATENEIKYNQTQGFFDVIARDIERNTLKPLIQYTMYLMRQFGGDKGLPDGLKVKVGGLSIMLQTEKQAQRIMQVMGLVGKAPQILGPLTDIPRLYSKLLGIFGVGDAYRDPSKQPRGGQPQMPGEPPMGPGPGMAGGGQPGGDPAAAAKQLVANMSPEEREMLRQKMQMQEEGQ